MSKLLNIDGEVMFLYKKSMKIKISDFEVMDSSMLLIIIYQLHLLVQHNGDGSPEPQFTKQNT